MEHKRKEISVSEHKIIVERWKDGKNRRNTDRSVGRQYSSIQHIINSFKPTGVYASKPRSGRPSKFTIRVKRSMISLEKNFVFD
ncbi:hypothetical protein TNCV_73941 [Trichonephila clavipes]|nr:hypothetical protein TNCV_73941 [Trichonephila clavipes]